MIIFQEMEPFLPVTSKCARFCLSAATVIFWVTECLTLFLYVIYNNSEYFSLPIVTYCHSFTCVCVCVCVCSPQISLIVACIIGVIAYRLAVHAAFASIIKDL